MISDAVAPRRCKTDMTLTAVQSIDVLAAPGDDDGILIWPSGGSLVDAAKRNRLLRNQYEFELAGKTARHWFANVGDAPLNFLTGHQPEFFHPGVWAKNAGVSRLAALARGTASFLVVDSDTPQRLAIEWPDDSEGACRIGRSALTRFKTGPSYEHLGPSGADEICLLLDGAPDEIAPGERNLVAAFKAGWHAAAGNAGADYTDCWTAGMRAMESRLGIASPDYQRVSVWFDWHGGDSVMTPVQRASAAFVAHVILHAAEFSRRYNAALACYRQRRGMHGNQHPIPDLGVSGDRIELPFWFVGDRPPRHRLWVSNNQNGVVTLYAEDNKLGELRADPVSDDLIDAMRRAVPSRGLRPRALAQTLFARLFLCDLFVHGIGGAKYDTITDEIVRTFFGVEPPAYACVTATLRLPVRRFGVEEKQIARARNQVRDIRYNPQRYLNQEILSGPAATWIERREAAIQESDALHRARSRDRERRRAAYREIRRVNHEILTLQPDVIARAQGHLEQVRRQFESDRIALSREWFVALHAEDALRRLVTGVNNELGKH